MKQIAAAVASEAETSAVKYRIEDRMPHNPRAICRPGRLGMTTAQPWRATNTVVTKTKAPPWRKNTTSIGW